MSKTKGISVSGVDNSVKQMIKDKYQLSVAHYNSLYLYTHDKKQVISLSEYHTDDPKHKDEYSLDISNVPGAYQINIDKDFYDELLLSIARYNEAEKKNSALKIKDIIKYYEKNKHLGEKEVAALLIIYLMQHKCPTNVLNRSYIFFDKYNVKNPEEKHPGIWHLNHENKLVKYDTLKGQQWFFVGEAGSRTFDALNDRAQRIFRSAENAYRRQK